MRHHLSHAVRLQFEPLEGRAVPAGNVIASLVGGRLTMTGDDRDNGLTLSVTGTDVTLTPDNSTSVNGQGLGMAVTLSGATTSLAANLHGGDDTLAIDPNSDFVLTGAAAINLGDGTNTLNLTTSGRLSLGSLGVSSGPGSNLVTVAPATRGTVTGAASFAFGPGGSNGVTLRNTDFRGLAGVRVAVRSGGSNDVTATNVTVARTVSVNTGRTGALQTFDDDTLGGLTVTGAGPRLIIRSTTINGNLSEIGTFTPSGQVSDSTVTGDVTMRSGSYASLTGYSGIFTAGNVTITSGTSSILSTSGSTFTVGNVTLASGGTSGLTVPSAFTARNVSISGANSGQFQATGPSATINGNLTVTSRQDSVVTFNTTALSEVRGNITEGGSSLTTSFLANGRFQADRNVTVTAAPDNAGPTVSIGDTTAAAEIRGNLTVTSGNGKLGLTLTDLTVGGATRVTTGAGDDALQIDATTFRGAFTANTGAGDDTFAIGLRTGMPAPVTFGGLTTINAGPGNDTLRLGRSVAASGDANSAAVFSVPASRLNGGPGFNTYFESTAQVTGLTAANFLNWTNV